jgi:ATP-dependent Clp protease ATP-binding subunit ClpC
VFERYTESARRALFFSRYESSQLGALAISAEHLLLGLLRGPKGDSAERILREASVTYDSVSRELARTTAFRERVSTAIEIPFDEGVKAILRFATDEADDLKHRHIGTEHLLLGLLRKDGTAAAAILNRCGLTLARAREQVQAMPLTVLAPGPGDAPARVGQEGLEALIRRLASMHPDDPERNQLEAAIIDLIRSVRERLQ